MTQTNQTGSDDWRGMIFFSLHQAGKLTDEFLPPEEFLTVRDKPYAEWPESLKKKLAPYGAEMVRLADSQQ